MQPRRRYHYVYLVHSITFYSSNGIEYPMTPCITNFDLFQSYEEAKRSILNDFKYWSDTRNPFKRYAQIDEPSRMEVGGYYLELGGYRVDFLDREGKPSAKVGKLYRYRL